MSQPLSALDPTEPEPDGPLADPAWEPLPAAPGEQAEADWQRELDGSLGEIDLAEAVARLKRVFAGLEHDLVGFGPLLVQALYALLTRENLLVFSPAGTAKTLFAGLLFSRIAGARLFDTQMSKGTLAEELFGSIDTEQMKRGRVVHNTRGTLVDADMAFIDELFDANDMVLRALLGVLHERVFKKGCQLEKARLHTGIAATNYLRATEVTEAVLDRFLLRAYVAPDYRPHTLLAIDQAFARHYGRADFSPPEEQVPLEHLSYLADVVRGLIPDRQIAAAPHMLFLKNLVINRYRELLASQSDPKRRAAYISPRTYAKARIVLNAAALLRGRTEVALDDLGQLKYAVTTVGGPEEQSEAFDKALRETLNRVGGADLEHVDNLAAAGELAEQIMARLRDGEKIPCTSFVKRLLRFFGLIGEGEVTFAHVRHFVDEIKPGDDLVRQLKLGVLQRLQELTRRVDRPDLELLW